MIFEDNQSAIFMAKNPQYHGRAKHIDIKYHFIRDQIANGVIDLKYCNTDDMVADMFTKGLSGEQFKKLRQLAGLNQLVNHFCIASEKECWFKKRKTLFTKMIIIVIFVFQC